MVNHSGSIDNSGSIANNWIERVNDSSCTNDLIVLESLDVTLKGDGVWITRHPAANQDGHSHLVRQRP